MYFFFKLLQVDSRSLDKKSMCQRLLIAFGLFLLTKLFNVILIDYKYVKFCVIQVVNYHIFLKVFAINNLIFLQCTGITLRWF